MMLLSMQFSAASCYFLPCSQTPSISVFSLKVKDQVSHPYKTTGKIMS